jgi:hypothetical protein
VAAPAPVLQLRPTYQAEVRLEDQGSRLEGLAGLLVRQPGGGRLAQLVVDERQQLGGPRVAGLDRGQDLGDVGRATSVRRFGVSHDWKTAPRPHWPCALRSDTLKLFTGSDTTP